MLQSTLGDDDDKDKVVGHDGCDCSTQAMLVMFVFLVPIDADTPGEAGEKKEAASTARQR